MDTVKPEDHEPYAHMAEKVISPFHYFHEVYRDRLREARSAQRSGKVIVGYVGNTVPIELIIAAGCFPLRVAPIAGTTANADRYVESFTDVDARLIVELYIAGELDFLSRLVVPRSTEAYHKLYLSLRELKRVGVAQAGPEVILYEILHTQRTASREYGLARTRELAKRLSVVGGSPVCDDSLAPAIAASNQTRRLLARLQQSRRRADQPVSGYQAHIVTGAGNFLGRHHYNQLLADWLDSPQIGTAPGPRLLVKGCPLDHAYLHELVEMAGGQVVAEDDDWGARAAEPLLRTEGSPLAAVFDHYYSEVPCPRTFPASLGEQWFMKTLQAGFIDGVVFYLPIPDDVLGWDFPRQRAAAEAAGLTWRLVRSDVRYPENRPAVAAMLGKYVGSLQPEGGGDKKPLATIS